MCVEGREGQGGGEPSARTANRYTRLRMSHANSLIGLLLAHNLLLDNHFDLNSPVSASHEHTTFEPRLTDQTSPLKSAPEPLRGAIDDGPCSKLACLYLFAS
jgi:hypothetical protein